MLTDRSWLSQSVDEPVTVLGGLIPLEGALDGSVFVVRCLARSRADLGGRRWSGWLIYGRVSGGTAATLGEFLGGGGRLLEYGLCYPAGSIVQHRADCRSFAGTWYVDGVIAGSPDHVRSGRVILIGQ